MARDLIYAALVRAVQTDGAIRLVQPAEDAYGRGLFPSIGMPYAEAIRHAVPQWLREDPRAPNQPRQVRLTDAGLEILLEWTIPEDRARLVVESSPLYQAGLFSHWSILIQRHHWHNDLPRWAQCGARLAEPFQSPSQARSEGQNGDSSEEETQSGDFKRAIASELVISWKHTDHPDAREGLARAMRSVGLQQIGQANEDVEFKGRYHISDAAMFPGDRARITTPGWMIHDGTGEYLLEKAVTVPL